MHECRLYACHLQQLALVLMITVTLKSYTCEIHQRYVELVWKTEVACVVQAAKTKIRLMIYNEQKQIPGRVAWVSLCRVKSRAQR